MAKRKPRSNGDYNVGYGKPPKATQFKPGRSGNPKGRPKGRKNLATEFREVMENRVSVQEDGRRKKISAQRALILTLFKKALGGDVKSIALVFSQCRQLLEPEDVATTDTDALTEQEQAILDAFEEDVLRRAQLTTQPQPQPQTRHRARPRSQKEPQS